MNVFLVIISNKFTPHIYIDSVYAYEEEAEEQIQFLEQELGPEYKFDVEVHRLQGTDEA